MAVRKSQTLRPSRRSKDTDPTRIISTDKKAAKAGTLCLALKGVPVKPTDEVDVEKTYELIAVPE